MTRLPITTTLLLATLSFGAEPAMAGDAAAGEKVFNKCKACHQVGEKAKNRVGPVLNGVVGRAAGTAEGFRYSDAMSESGLVWDEAALATFLADPKATVPGNKMAFPGLRKDEEITNVIAFLASYAADGTRK
ncbi:cytochrome c family protein [Roseovarius sp. A46]|uniref:c-type cytochrome n=1 Tax=Roseovarius sp. A46 TaxID=2109331 RepID=UPI0010120158|nr:cytochrome c family protein [Roseovarius sp. A46]RXV59295.1 cytochrome c family protein [Roseovarius sp. A46]|tara:strand:- start:81 stop:476 length:396 start_codon:yes stop_codon:yes gene_type:complete